MAKKAVSPVIAVVILIAVAITIGGLVSSWLSSFVQERSQQDTCPITTSFNIEEPFYNASSGKIKIKVKNTGKDDLYNFTIEADNGTLIAEVPASSPSETYRLSPGESQYIIGNASAYNITNVATVSVLVGSCPRYSPSPVKV